IGLVANVNPPTSFPYGSNPYWMTTVGGTTFFIANNYELWKTDGTAAGTQMLHSSFGVMAELFNANGTFYFGADDGLNGAELWKSDGTAAGTVMVKDVNPG